MNDVNKEIMEWVHAQPHWVQLAVTKVYAQEEVMDDLIDELLILLKTKTGQSKENKIELSGAFRGPSVATGDIRILSLGILRVLMH